MKTWNLYVVIGGISLTTMVCSILAFIIPNASIVIWVALLLICGFILLGIGFMAWEFYKLSTKPSK